VARIDYDVDVSSKKQDVSNQMLNHVKYLNRKREIHVQGVGE